MKYNLTPEALRNIRESRQIIALKVVKTPKKVFGEHYLQKYGLTRDELIWLASCPVRLAVLSRWFGIPISNLSYFNSDPKKRVRDNGKPKVSVQLAQEICALYHKQQERRLKC